MGRSDVASVRKQTVFEDMFREHYPAILRFAARRIDMDTAHDVADETFTIAWRRLDDIPAGLDQAWLFATARNVLANELRRSGRRDRLHERVRSETAGAQTVPDIAEQVSEQDLIRGLLRQLPALDREVLELAEWDGLSCSEIAAVLGCSTPALRVRLHRARRRLVALYEHRTATQTSTRTMSAQSSVRSKS